MSSQFDNKSILITGGTGSFGQAFTKHLLQNSKPKKVIIFSRDEFKQYTMSQEINHPSMRYFIGDVRDYSRVEAALENADFVVHAAAMKQVEASEYNPTECIRTNIQGAENIIRAALYHEVKKVVALSTDKAASPINLYGATKLVSDKLFISANNITGHKETEFSVVRYGNVIGSRGSVIPLFKSLISQGEKKLPVTHEEMTRFCITLDQGVDFVSKTFIRMHGGEIFVPKLPSMKITDLASIMSPTSEYEIIGIRSGEKIHEIMIPYDETRLTVEYPNFFLIKPSIDLFTDHSVYSSTANKEKAKNDKINYEYSSGTNSQFLKSNEIMDLINDY